MAGRKRAWEEDNTSRSTKNDVKFINQPKSQQNVGNIFSKDKRGNLQKQLARDAAPETPVGASRIYDVKGESNPQAETDKRSLSLELTRFIYDGIPEAASSADKEYLNKIKNRFYRTADSSVSNSEYEAISEAYDRAVNKLKGSVDVSSLAASLQNTYRTK